MFSEQDIYVELNMKSCNFVRAAGRQLFTVPFFTSYTIMARNSRQRKLREMEAPTTSTTTT